MFPVDQSEIFSISSTFILQQEFIMQEINCVRVYSPYKTLLLYPVYNSRSHRVLGQVFAEAIRHQHLRAASMWLYSGNIAEN